MSSFLFGFGFGLSFTLAVTFGIRHHHEKASPEDLLLGPEPSEAAPGAAAPSSLADALAQQPASEGSASADAPQT